MKKMIVVALAISLFMIACHRKSVPTVSARTEQPPPPVPPVPKEEAMAYEATDIEAGRPIFETRCARCHTKKNTADYTPERWTGILKSMIPKARLSETEAKQVTAYVMTNAKKS